MPDTFLQTLRRPDDVPADDVARSLWEQRETMDDERRATADAQLERYRSWRHEVQPQVVEHQRRQGEDHVRNLFSGDAVTLPERLPDNRRQPVERALKLAENPAEEAARLANIQFAGMIMHRRGSEVEPLWPTMRGRLAAEMFGVEDPERLTEVELYQMVQGEFERARSIEAAQGEAMAYGMQAAMADFAGVAPSVLGEERQQREAEAAEKAADRAQRVGLPGGPGGIPDPGLIERGMERAEGLRGEAAAARDRRPDFEGFLEKARAEVDGWGKEHEMAALAAYESARVLFNAEVDRLRPEIEEVTEALRAIFDPLDQVGEGFQAYNPRTGRVTDHVGRQTAVVSSVVERMMEMDADDRMTVYSAIEAWATARGEHDKEFWQQIGEAFERGVARTIFEGLPGGFDVRRWLAVQRQLETAEPVTTAPPGSSPTGVVAGMRTLSGALASIGGADWRRMTDEEITAARKLTRLGLEYHDVRRELRDIGEGSINPIIEVTKLPGWVERGLYGAADSVSYTALAAAPKVGWTLTWSALTDMEYQRMRREQPHVDPRTAYNYAQFTAMPMALFERFQWMAVTGKFTGIGRRAERMFGPGSGFRKRMAGYTAGNIAEQNFQEAMQDIVPYIAQGFASLASDIEAPGLRESIEEFINTRPEVFVALLPLVLAGTTTRGAALIGRQESAILQNATIMEALGFSPDIAQRISIAEARGEAAERNQLLRENWVNRNAPSEELGNLVMAELGMPLATGRDGDALLRAVATGQEGEAVSLLSDDAAFPEVVALAEDQWQVTFPDGRVEDYQSGEVARERAQEYYAVQQDTGRAEVSVLIRELQGRMHEDIDVREQSERKRTLQDDLDAGLVTFDEAMGRMMIHSRETGEDIRGMTPADFAVLGRTRVEAEGEYRRYIAEVFRGAQPQTVLEEVAESSWRRWLDMGVVTEAQLQGWLEHYNAVVREADQINLAAPGQAVGGKTLIESMARLSMGYFVGHAREAGFTNQVMSFLRRIRSVVAGIFRTAQALRRMKAKGQLPKDFEAFLSESLGLSEEVTLDLARREHEAAIEAEVNAGRPEIQESLRGRLPRPSDMRDNDPLRGDVQRIWDGFSKLTTARRGRSEGRSVVNRAAASAWFAPKGTKIELDALREQLNEEGYAFDTIGDMLAALEDSMAGNPVYGDMSVGFDPEIDADWRSYSIEPSAETKARIAKAVEKARAEVDAMDAESVRAVGEWWLAVGRLSGISRFPQELRGGTLTAIARHFRDIVPGLKVEEGFPAVLSVGEQKAYIFADKRNVWLDVSAASGKEAYIDLSLRKRGSLGAVAYQMAQALARNTGRQFAPDPGGVSEIAFARRWPQMLSSAIRFQTTAHLDGRDDSSRWSEDDHALNVGLLAMQELAYVKQFTEGIGDLKLSPDWGMFIDGEGTQISREALGDHVRGSGDAGAFGVGPATLRRAVATQHAAAESGISPGQSVRDSIGQQRLDPRTDEATLADLPGDSRRLSDRHPLAGATYSIMPAHRLAQIDQALAAGARRPGERVEYYRVARQRLERIADRFDARFRAMEMRMADSEETGRVELERTVAEMEAILSAMPPEVRGRIGKIAGLLQLKTDRGRLRRMRDMLRKLDTEVERHMQREYRGKVYELLERYEVRPDPKTRVPKGKLGPAAQAEIDAIIEIANRDPVENAKEMAAIQLQMEGAIVEGQDIGALADRWTMLHLYGALESADAVTLEQALANLEAIAQRGRAVRKVLDEERRQRYAELRAMILRDVTGGAGLKSMAEAAEATAGRKARPKRERMREFHHMNQSWEWLLNAATRADVATGTLGAATVKHFGRLAHQATHAERRGNRAWQEDMTTALMSIFQATSFHDLTKKLEQFKERQHNSGVFLVTGQKTETLSIPIERAERIAYGQQKDDRFSPFDRAVLRQTLEDNAQLPPRRRKRKIEHMRVLDAGKAEEQFISQDEALYWSMLWLQPDMQVKLETSGFNDSVATQLEKFLSPEAKALRDWLMRRYADEYDGLNAVFQQLFFVSMPRIQNYSPARFESQQQIETGIMDGGTALASTTPGFARSRVMHKARVQQAGAMDIYMRHMLEGEHFKAWALPIQEMRATLGSKDAQMGIKQFQGEEVLRLLNQRIEDFIAGGRKGAAVHWMDALRSGFTISRLSYNWGVFVKQLSSFPAFLYDVPAGAFLKYQAEFWKSPVKHFGEMWALPYTRQRFEEGADRDVMRVLRDRGFTKPKTRLRRAAEWGMISGRAGDILPVMVGGYAAYRHAYDTAIAEGKVEADARREAELAYEMAADRAQQAGDIKDLSEFQLGGSLARLFTMFMTSPRQYYSNTYDALLDWRAGRKDGGQEFAKRVAIGHVILPLLFQAISMVTYNLPRDEEDQDWSPMQLLRAMLLGPLNGLFVIGSMLDTAMFWATRGRHYGTDFGSPAFTAFAPGMYSLGRALRMIESGEADPADVLSVADGLARTISSTRGGWYEIGRRLGRSVGIDGDDIHDLLGISDP